MELQKKAPGLHMSSCFLVALSLSIGWGIRGNFGHETGAMIAGVLAVVAGVLVSGRFDWRQRVGYFALFAGLGWGFGGSIAYMYPISFAGSGHAPSVWYGFFSIVLVGGLWAGMGGVGTALPAVMVRERMRGLFAPLCFVLFAMALGRIAVEPVLNSVLQSRTLAGYDATWTRHADPLYWFDADWLAAVFALCGICAYDLWERRFAKVWLLGLLGACGAALGLLLQQGLRLAGWENRIAQMLTVPLGDTTVINPETGLLFDPTEFLTNWPCFFVDYPQHVGWLAGLCLGIGLYFLVCGRWRGDAKLFLYMALGWLGAFLLMPVLGTIFLQSWGGFRLMPPRSDDWAGILGVFIATSIYCWRNELKAVTWAACLSFVMGGIAFATVPFVRSLVRLPGHPFRNPGGNLAYWQHFQSANWHSVMEQGQGFVYGIVIAVVLGLLATRVPFMQDGRTLGTRNRLRGDWTESFAVGFVLLGITLLNAYKCVETWVKSNCMPATMKAPLIQSIELPAIAWFGLVWIALSIAGIALLCVHRRRPLAFIPESWLGRGQLLYLVFLWAMVLMNFFRAVTQFSEGRLITEWVIFINACLATFLVCFLPREDAALLLVEPKWSGRLLWRSWGIGLLVAGVFISLYSVATVWAYQDKTWGHPSGCHKRFGEEAQWRIHPILKHGKHS